MMMKKFFRVTPSNLGTPLYLISSNSRFFNSDTDLLPYIRGENTYTHPLEMSIKGKKKVDILPCCGYLALTVRVVDLLRRHQFTGWDSFPIKIDKPERVSGSVVGLVVKGRLGPSSKDYWSDISNWDGSDFAVHQYGFGVTVTERVIAAFEAEKITGAEWEPVNVIQGEAGDKEN